MGPPYEETELRLVFGADGTIDLVAVVTTGEMMGAEVVVARNITLETGPPNVLNYSQTEVTDVS